MCDSCAVINKIFFSFLRNLLSFFTSTKKGEVLELTFFIKKKNMRFLTKNIINSIDGFTISTYMVISCKVDGG